MPVTANITSVSPSTGIVGTHVQINGGNFFQSGLRGVVVFSNGITASVISYTNTQIIASVPSGAVTGVVFLEFSGGNSNTKPFTVTTPAAPTISSLSPNNGGVGSLVTINGTNFGSSQGQSVVSFNNVGPVIASWTNTAIKLTVPPTATTGPVFVIVGTTSSNSVTFTVTNPSNGGTSQPLGMLLIPCQQFNTQVLLTFDITNFDDPAIGGFYNYKVEEIIPGRTPSCTRQVITYRDLGVATLTATLTGTLSPVGDANIPTVTSNSETFNIGTPGATQKLFTIVRGLSLTAQNLQYSFTRQPGNGPVSIIRVHLEGATETEPYS